MTDTTERNKVWRQGFLDAAYMLLRLGREDVLKAAKELEGMEDADFQAHYFELLQKRKTA